MSDEASQPASQAPAGGLPRRAFLGLALGLVGGLVFFLRRSLRRDDDDEAILDRPSRVADERALAPYHAPVFAAGAPALSFLALGDTGWAGPVLDEVATAMERVASTLPFSFVCLLGDNFYQQGVESVRDPRWQEGFERVFAGAHLAVPFRAALGNHDHEGNVQAQVEYSALSRRWSMPAQYYSYVEPVGAGVEAEFFVLDTEALRRRDRAAVEQLRWFEEKIGHSRAAWKIVIGHHPVCSNGEHGAIDRVRDDLEPLLDRHGVALYLSGHDHDLELLETGKGFLQVVSGAGSSTRDMRWGEDTLFASVGPGFVWVGIQGDELWLVFVDAARGPLFSRRLTLAASARSEAELAPSLHGE